MGNSSKFADYSESDLVPKVRQVPKEVWDHRHTGSASYYLGQDHETNAHITESLFHSSDGKALIIGKCPWQSAKEIADICDKVHSSYRELNALTMKERIDLGKLLAQYLRQEKPLATIAATIVLETGKTLKDARVEVVRTAEFLEGYAKELENVITEKVIDGHRVRFFGKGLVAHFGPSNYPINEGLTVVVAKLLAGNPTVWKSPTTCMASTHALEQLVIKPAFEEFAKKVPHFPKHCLAVLYGRGLDVAPVLARKIDQICYIGSEAGKDSIWNELDRHRGTSDRIFAVSTMNPYIVTPNNKTVDETVRQLMTASYSNRGERCTAAGLIFIPRSQEQKYLDAMISIAKEYKLGEPWEDGISITSPSEGAVKNKSVLSEIAQALTVDDATLVFPKEIKVQHGIIPPVLLCVKNLNAPIAENEPFGIMTKIYVYDDSKRFWIDEILEYYRRINRGQQVAIFGPSEEAERIANLFIGITGGIFINVAGGRGPDSLPFEHLGRAGFGSLSGYAPLYWESVRPLRWTVKAKS